MFLHCTIYYNRNSIVILHPKPTLNLEFSFSFYNIKVHSYLSLILIITSLAKEVMFLVALVSLSVCLSVDNITQKSYERIGMKFYGGVQSSTRTN